MRVLAVIPARMGSSRVPRKNAQEIEPGMSLAQHAVYCAIFSSVITRAVVSTDNPAAIGPIKEAEISQRPSELSGPTSDIADTVRYEVERMARLGQHFDLVATLQPAVLARSPLIVSTLIQGVIVHNAHGGVTMARSHPFVWRDDGRGAARARWLPGPYPRSQDAGPHFVEINGCQVTTTEVALTGKRWDVPLVVAEVPSWCQALDIDTLADLSEARELWPWAAPRLAKWVPPLHVFERVSPET